MFTGRLALAAFLLLAPAAFAGPVYYTVALNGANEAPPNASPATGSALVAIDTLAHTLMVDATFSGLLVGNTAAHIHCCTADPGVGTAGVATTTPTFTGFPSGVTSGSYLHTFDLTLTTSWNASYITNNGGTPGSAEAAFAAGAADGKAYLNIHTSMFPGGEIRGFLQPTPEPGTWLMAGSALIGLAFRRLRR